MSEMTRNEALRIAIECLRAHSIGPAGVFGQAANVLQAELWISLMVYDQTRMGEAEKDEADKGSEEAQDV